MLDFIKNIREEWPVISQAPRTILLTVLLLTSISGETIYLLFNENISRKNDLIRTLQEQLEAEKKKVQQPPIQPELGRPSVPSKETPRSKSESPVHIFQRSQAPNSPNTAVVGNGNTVTVNPRAPYRTLTKEQGDRLAALLKMIGPHDIAFRHTQGNEESQQFSDQLQNIIVTQAGWNPRRPKFLISMRETYGLWVFVHDANAPPDGAVKLLDALNDKTVALGAKGIEVPGLEPETFDLMVGLAEPSPTK
jgi:hypothetical protein